ncbi:MAG: preprotein translocase subunit YajC [Egibacteraceae bacterium]
MQALAVLAQQQPGSAIGSFLPLLLIAVVFYFLLIRPQQQRQKKQRELIRSIGTGDLIVTIGGLHGTVQTLDDETVRLEIAPGTVVTVARQAVARRLVDADEPVTGDGT